MASQREDAKSRIVDEENEDQDLTRAFGQARDLQHTLASHQHVQAMKDKELGAIGRVLGSGSSAAIAIASLAFVFTLVVYIGLIIAVSLLDTAHAQLIAPYPDKVLALTTLALGVIVGGKMKD